MTLLVEDGTGLANADALISLEFFKAYCDAMGYDYSAKDEDDEIEPAIRRGSRYVSNSFAWYGLRLNGRAQAFPFPCSGMVDVAGYAVASNAVPIEVQRAVAEAAWVEVQKPGSLSPTIKAGGGVIKRVKAGSTEVEYENNGSATATHQSILDALSGLIRRASPYSGTAVRA